MATLSLDIAYSQSNNCGGSCSFSTLLPLSIIPSYSLGDIGCTYSTIEYTVTNENGAVVYNQTNNITNANPEVGDDIAGIFTPNDVGVYTIVVVLSDCSSSVTFNESIVVCSFLAISANLTAHSFSICNNHPTDIYSFVVYDLEDTIVVNSTTMQPLSMVNIDTTTDGVYKVVFEDNTSTIVQTSIITDYSNIMNCLTGKIQRVLCQDDCSCKCKDYCKERWELNRIIPLTTLFFVKANKEALINTIYVSLDSEKLTELNTIQDLMDKITSYCDTCTNSSTDNGLFSSNIATKGGCGCGCS